MLELQIGQVSRDCLADKFRLEHPPLLLPYFDQLNFKLRNFPDVLRLDVHEIIHVVAHPAHILKRTWQLHWLKLFAITHFAG